MLPAVSYEDWRETCDTLHAHTQLLGKLASALAPREPGFGHIALRLTARGWETQPLPAPTVPGALVVALDLRTHEALIEHSGGARRRVPLTPDRSVGDVTSEVLSEVAGVAGEVTIDPRPAEVPWTVPLDQDDEHFRYAVEDVERYFDAASEAALALAAFRAPYRGRATPVNAWWGSFDLAVSLFDNGNEFAVGWWPGDARHPQPALYAYMTPREESFTTAGSLPGGGDWDTELGEYVLDCISLRDAGLPEARARSPEARARAVAFAREAFERARAAAGWDPALVGDEQQ